VYRPLLDELSLTYPQYLAMLVLWERKACAVKEIGELLRLDYGTLTPLLKRLEVLGYVQRRRRVDDERGVEVTLTEEGVRLRQRAAGLPAELSHAFGLTDRQLSTLRDLLGELTDHTSRFVAGRRTA
jgi:DNA-binding MarR family transcriptional regulator